MCEQFKLMYCAQSRELWCGNQGSLQRGEGEWEKHCGQRKLPVQTRDPRWWVWETTDASWLLLILL